MGIFSTILQKFNGTETLLPTGESREHESVKIQRYIPRHPLARNLISSPLEIMCGSTAVYSL